MEAKVPEEPRGSADSPPWYHLEELAIARMPNDPRRILPPVPARCTRVIDIGCGIGQTLMATDLTGPGACGLDSDLAALRLGRRTDSRLQLICGAAEKLPIRSRWAELAIARLSLPYTHIPQSMGEIFRVLEPGGSLWAVLHPLNRSLQHLRESVRQLRPRALLYQLYVLVNGWSLHATGRQFRYPLNRKRCESFQTRQGISRALRAAGFEDIRVDHSPFFVATARKPPEA